VKLMARGIGVAIGGRPIVESASIDVSPGELVGLIGPNGAGKSTLLRVLAGVQPRTTGSVKLGEDRVDALPAAERARRIAYLPQERRVEWRLSVYDVVMLGRFPHERGYGGPAPASRRAVERALASVEAGGLEDRVVSTLSGGELARVLLARALAVEAPILLVDEPIDALDPYHQLHVMEILQAEARRGAAVLAVLHDLTLASRFMDRLVLMSEGEIVAEGPPQSVLTVETLAAVYSITTVRGGEPGDRFVIPWTRLPRAEAVEAALGEDARSTIRPITE
jgi:iron complex transport system ATP-binding protein